MPMYSQRDLNVGPIPPGFPLAGVVAAAIAKHPLVSQWFISLQSVSEPLPSGEFSYVIVSMYEGDPSQFSDATDEMEKTVERMMVEELVVFKKESESPMKGSAVGPFEPTVRRIHCNLCQFETKHEQLGDTHRRRYPLEANVHSSLEEIAEHALFECMGCESVTLVYHGYIGSHPLEEVFYPARIRRPRPTWLHPLELQAWFSGQNAAVPELLSEIYASLQSESFRLAALGIRSLIEHVMISALGGDQNSISANRNALVTEGRLTEAQAKRLDAVLEVGNATMHRAFKPPPENVYAALDLAEDMVHQFYLAEDRAEKAKNDVPARPPKKPRKKTTSS